MLASTFLSNSSAEGAAPGAGEGSMAEGKWYGARRFFEWLETKSYKMHVRVLLSKYRAYTPCAACSGARLKPESLAVKIAKKSIAEVTTLSVRAAADFFLSLAINKPGVKFVEK